MSSLVFVQNLPLIVCLIRFQLQLSVATNYVSSGRYRMLFDVFVLACKLLFAVVSSQGLQHLTTFIADCDRKTEVAKRRLKETQEELTDDASAKVSGYFIPPAD